MALIVVNPTPRAKAKSAKRTPATPARKAATRGAKPMAKRRRTAAQKAATARMISANRRHRNPSPVRHYKRRAAVRRNPSPVHHYRRRRNPSSGGSGDLMKELLSKEGLMSIAAVVGMPTVTELIVGQFAASSTGYTRIAIKAAAGMALAYALHKFVSKRVGLIAGMVAGGSAVAEAIHQYQAGNLLASVSTTAAATQGYLRPMQGYTSPGVVRF